jgi:hypothetical protein
VSWCGTANDLIGCCSVDCLHDFCSCANVAHINIIMYYLLVGKYMGTMSST